MGRKMWVVMGALIIVAISTLIVLTVSPTQWDKGVTSVREEGELNVTETDKLVVVVNVGVSKKVSLEEARELESFLEDSLGMPVDVVYPTSSAAIIESLRFGHAHVALGPGSLVGALALKVADVEMPLVEYREVIVDGKKTVSPYYYSYFIVLRDSPYRYLSELRGKRACFPSPTSTSGFIMPMKLMVDGGFIDPRGVKEPRELAERFFGEVTFGGGYAQCWEALRKGQVDVAVIAGDVVESLFWEAMNNSRVLLLDNGDQAAAGPNPSHVVLVSKRLDPELRQRVVDALLRLNERPELMRKYVSAIFVRFGERSVEEHLGPLLDALEKIGLFEYYLGR